jgi:hypothetical protein
LGTFRALAVKGEEGIDREILPVEILVLDLGM